MSKLPHQVKCRSHPQSSMLFIEQPKSSPHAFKGVCTECSHKFIGWVSMEQLDAIVAAEPNVSIKPLPTTTFDKFFGSD